MSAGGKGESSGSAARQEPFHDALAIAVPQLDMSGSPEPDGDDLWTRMQRAQRDLAPRTWQALELRYLQQKSIDDVAKMLGISRQNAKVVLHRGRHDLAELVRWESCSLLDGRHVRDWRRFCEIMSANAHRPTVPGVLWSGFDGPLQLRVRRLAAPGAKISTEDIDVLVSSLNGLLRRPDLWPKKLLNALSTEPHFPDAANALLKKRQLGSIATLRLNRLILEFGLIDVVIASIPTVSEHDAIHE